MPSSIVKLSSDSRSPSIMANELGGAAGTIRVVRAARWAARILLRVGGRPLVRHEGRCIMCSPGVLGGSGTLPDPSSTGESRGWERSWEISSNGVRGKNKIKWANIQPDVSSLNQTAPVVRCAWINGRVKCILIAALGRRCRSRRRRKNYWSLNLLHSVYLHNRLVHTITKITPFEPYYGLRLDLSHLKVFGSRVCVKISGIHHGKLDRHDFKGIFLGYTTTDQNIVYLNLNTGVVKRSHHAQFDEAWYLQRT